MLKHVALAVVGVTATVALAGCGADTKPTVHVTAASLQESLADQINGDASQSTTPITASVACSGVPAISKGAKTVCYMTITHTDSVDASTGAYPKTDYTCAVEFEDTSGNYYATCSAAGLDPAQFSGNAADHGTATPSPS